MVFLIPIPDSLPSCYPHDTLSSEMLLLIHLIDSVEFNQNKIVFI